MPTQNLRIEMTADGTDFRLPSRNMVPSLHFATQILISCSRAHPASLPPDD